MRVCRSEKIGSPAWKASSRCPHVLVSAGAARYIRTDSSEEVDTICDVTSGGCGGCPCQ